MIALTENRSTARGRNTPIPPDAGPTPPPMLLTAIFPNRYVQGAGALESFADHAKVLGQKLLVIAGGTARRDVVPALRERSTAAGLTLAVEAPI